MAVISPVPKLQFFDANGNPLAGGKLYSYVAGTTTPQATYTDAGGGTPNTNPVILDSRGEASVWLGSSAYKLKLATATDVEVWTVDNVAGAATLAQLAASGGSALIGFLQAGTGAVERTAQSKMRETVSVFDFMTTAQIANIQSNTGNIDVTVAIQAAINSLSPGGGTVYLPPGTYYLSSSLSAVSEVNIVGAGKGATILKIAANGITFTGQSFCHVSDLQFIGTGGSPGTALYFASGNTSDLVIKNVYVQQCANAIKNAAAAVITVMQVIECFFINMNDWQVDLPAGVFNGLTFQDTRFEGTSAQGAVRATNLEYSRFHGCIFESLKGSTGAVELTNCQAYFHQCLFYDNAVGITGGSDIKINAGNQGVVHIYDCKFGPANGTAVNHNSIRKTVSLNTLLRVENCFADLDNKSQAFFSVPNTPDSVYFITNKLTGSPSSGQLIYRNNAVDGGDVKELNPINDGVAYSKKVDLIRCSRQTTDNSDVALWGGSFFGPLVGYPAKDCYVLYEATVLCRSSTGADYGAWDIKHLFQIVDAGGGNFTITSISSSWSASPIRSSASLLASFAITDNNTAAAGIKLEVRGLVATTIDWTASVKFTAVF